MKLPISKRQFDFILRGTSWRSRSREILWDYLQDPAATTRTVAEKFGITSGRVGHYIAGFYQALEEALEKNDLELVILMVEPEWVEALNQLDYSNVVVKRAERHLNKEQKLIKKTAEKKYLMVSE